MKKGSIKPTSRADDERVLKWLKWRCQGATAKAIGRLSGHTNTFVRTATNRIKDADLAESGEPEQIVRGAYW